MKLVRSEGGGGGVSTNGAIEERGKRLPAGCSRKKLFSSLKTQYFYGSYMIH